MTPTPGRLRRFLDTRRARSDGRRDGRRGIPTAHEPSAPPALAQIAHRGAEALAVLAKTVAKDEARRHEQLEAVEHDRHEAELDVDAAADRIAAGDPSRSGDSFAATAPDRGPRISRRVYVTAIVAIVIAEFPLNAIAFRLFQEAEILTYVMTAGMAIMFVACAHGLGSFLRVQNPSMAERRWIAVLIALPMLTILAIAVIRARYLAISSELIGLDTLGPVASSIAFLIINLLVYTGATMLSYLAHAPSDRVRTEREHAQRELKEATRRARSFEQQHVRLGASDEEALKAARAWAEQIIAYHRGLMAAYCTANLRARGNPEVPQSLRQPPSIHVPAALWALPVAADEGGGPVAPVRELHQAAAGAER